MWWGISDWTLVGLGAVSVRLGGRWHLQRRPGNPTCFAPSCAAHSALARAPSCASFVRLLWRGSEGLGAAWVLGVVGGNQRRPATLPCARL